MLSLYYSTHLGAPLNQAQHSKRYSTEGTTQADTHRKYLDLSWSGPFSFQPRSLLSLNQSFYRPEGVDGSSLETDKN